VRHIERTRSPPSLRPDTRLSDGSPLTELPQCPVTAMSD
jgi:hypothetical protein